MFMVITTYKKPIKDVEEFLPAHSAFLDQLYKERRVIFSGRRTPRIGGIILYNVDTEESVSKIIEADPFKKNGIAEYELFEFTPTKYDEKFKSFISD